ncbi:hypothetical protein A3A40_00340 [Candidatus Kaiserbacteria bacterium RIFCSPLOWO2_01_FULL_54_20]|uniref:DNA methylase N-4/N-6 domain-containing protein n=1 Tax=Candidatus Kaiserbacteria bacterium RIFCSPLOWO2_01_FULL_54_20 TaxID=1798513 RepID=A0A1F6EKJ9_9BACT|nr:MAG: hypothetical protein A3A40_00340 [Candidatus Kaiserbacteria bacterium RIFCSPLOWO2_01_FULL_54_20]
MASLNFKGKSAVWNHHLSVPYHTLENDQKRSLKGENADRNLIIEGDNLLALKSLLPQYQGKVKCIYIDPPYNTGKEEWVYSDNVSSPTIKEWIGEVVGPEGEDLTRHDKWLCMMTPRLKLLRELLANDGVIFVSIDDNEAADLRLLMDSIFGIECFAAALIWNKGHSQQQGVFKNYHEYVLVYGKKPLEAFEGGEGEIVAGALKKISTKNPAKEFTFPAGVRFDAADGTIIDADFGDGEKVHVISGRLVAKSGVTTEEVTLKAGWTQADQMKDWFYGDKDNVVDTRGQKVLEFFFSSTGKLKSRKERRRITPSTILPSFGVGSEHTAELAALFEMSESPFGNPKPVNMLKEMISWVTSDDDIVLDSFAGSGTTAQAVLELNADEDESNRRFILVQLQEETKKDTAAYKAGYRYVHEITRERVKRVIEKSKSGKGFEYFTLGPAIDAETLLSGTLPTYREFAKYVYYLATGKNHPAESKIKETDFFVGEADRESIYLVYEKDMEKLKKLAVTLDWAQKTHKKDSGKKIVYAPACFLDDEALEQYNIQFVSVPYNLFERTE